jgi:uncharacterized MAPEG superfamily protein
MTTDLWMLLGALALYWVIVMIPASAKIVANGMPWAVGNRDVEPVPALWVARADRLAANFLENLPIFAGLVLIAHVSGTADETTALGARLFVGFRIMHAGFYLAGVPWLRTLAWLGSAMGMGLMAYSIVS